MKFGYARVSKNNQNLEMQIDALTKYGVDEIYEEKASSVKKNRQELGELLSKLRTGDTLVIWKLDRLGRTVKQLLQLAEDFESKGINFVSLTEGFDTTTPVGKFTFHIMCSVAQMERDVQIERTKSGLEAARKRGRTGGRKPKDQAKINTALKMYFSNEHTIKDIIDATGVSKTTLYKYINNHNEKNNTKGVD